MEILIGRKVDGDHAIKVDNPVVSSKHCRVCKDEQTGVYYIEDLGSLNGTTVNGVTIKRMEISANDKIQLGGEGGYETTLAELLSKLKNHNCEHNIENLKKIYEDYQRDMAKLKTRAQIFGSIRIAPSLLIGAAGLILSKYNNPAISLAISASAIVLCLVISTILIRKNEEKIKARVTLFQMTYVCPKKQQPYGDRSWEILKNVGKCSFCNEPFK